MANNNYYYYYYPPVIQHSSYQLTPFMVSSDRSGPKEYTDLYLQSPNGGKIIACLQGKVWIVNRKRRERFLQCPMTDGTLIKIHPLPPYREPSKFRVLFNYPNTDVPFVKHLTVDFLRLKSWNGSYVEVRRAYIEHIDRRVRIMYLTDELKEFSRMLTGRVSDYKQREEIQNMCTSVVEEMRDLELGKTDEEDTRELINQLQLICQQLSGMIKTGDSETLALYESVNSISHTIYANTYY
eukprot:TRINITY_DN8763_c0_g1_i1.p1 TRINITY_DN8763_c0_g1~~TRINITY_DN8763_c0_g1_i1.p1  ORF type:complete len:239 (+),score=22.11 TRINITY_DN8763_c0_g1_i1:74-790(+)